MHRRPLRLMSLLRLPRARLSRRQKSASPNLRRLGPRRPRLLRLLLQLLVRHSRMMQQLHPHHRHLFPVLMLAWNRRDNATIKRTKRPRQLRHPLLPHQLPLRMLPRPLLLQPLPPELERDSRRNKPKLHRKHLSSHSSNRSSRRRKRRRATSSNSKVTHRLLL
jgi:hypothetical protein